MAKQPNEKPGFGIDGQSFMDMMLLATCPDERTKGLLKIFQKYGVRPMDAMACLMEVGTLLSQYQAEGEEPQAD